MTMSPASKEEWATVKECSVKISHLEDTIKELKLEIRNKKKEKIESQRDISNKKLAIYLTFASVLGAVMIKIIEWLGALLS